MTHDKGLQDRTNAAAQCGAGRSAKVRRHGDGSQGASGRVWPVIAPGLPVRQGGRGSGHGGACTRPHVGFYGQAPHATDHSPAAAHPAHRLHAERCRLRSPSPVPLRGICTSGSMSGVWKRGRVRLLRHRQTKGPETDRPSLHPSRHIPTLPLKREAVVSFEGKYYCRDIAHRALARL